MPELPSTPDVPELPLVPDVLEIHFRFFVEGIGELNAQRNVVVVQIAPRGKIHRASRGRTEAAE